MTRPRNRRRQRERDRDRRGWIIIGLAAVLLVAVLMAAVVFAPTPLGKNGCPTDRHSAPVAKTVILIDQTDALPPAELDYVRRLVKNEYFWLPKEGVLSIRLITADAPEGVTRLTACRMADGSGALGIVDNPVAMRKDYERKVGASLNAFLAGLAAQLEQVRSPILETIAATMNDPDFGPDIDARRLVIVSDMAQNSPTYSQYGLKRRDFRLPADQADTFAAGFGSTAIRIHYVRRPKLSWQGAAHQAFWQKYFEDRGATDIAIGHALAIGEPEGRKIWYEATENKNGNVQ